MYLESIKKLSLGELCNIWECTESINAPEIPTVRGWLMDELERRNPKGFNSWLESDTPEDCQLRQFLTCNAMCLNCTKFLAGCPGTTEQVWTGCVYRRIS